MILVLKNAVYTGNRKIIRMSPAARIIAGLLDVTQASKFLDLLGRPSAELRRLPEIVGLKQEGRGGQHCED